MATLLSTTLCPTTAPGNNAQFQAWAQFIEDTIVSTGGWTVGTDTGQTLPSALIAGGGVFSSRGFRIYKMSDPLQASFPVVMRIDYVCGSNVGSSPAIFFTIGTGTNGAGTITGVLCAATTVNNTNNQATAVGNSYGSAFHNRAAFALWMTSASPGNFPMIFMIERTKDALGADTGDGLLALYTSGTSSTNLGNSKYIKYQTGITQPDEEHGLNYVLTTQTPTEAWAPGDVGLGIPIHFNAVAQQPGTNCLITNSNDVSLFGYIRVVLYGVAKTYLQLGGVTSGKALTGNTTNGQNDAGSRILMRYE